MKPMILLLAWVLMGALAGYGIYILFLETPSVSPPANLTNDTPPANGTPPANDTRQGITVTFIEAPDCELCNSESYVFEQAKVILLQQDSVPVGAERTISLSEAENLISKYEIKTVPAVIIEGPVSDYPDLVSHWEQTLGSQIDGALVSAPLPPYHDVANGVVVGLLQGIAINPNDCRWCSDGGGFIASLQSLPASMVFSDISTYKEDDPEAVELIARHNITKLPAILVDEQVAAYPIYQDLATLGSISEGWFALRIVPPPFVDLEDNHTTKGLVKSIYLVDQSCTDCFDVRDFAAYLSQSAGLVVEQETYFDVRSEDGAALARDYNVTKIPTLLFSPDADYYPYFKEAWIAQGNTVADDGWYVFRTHDMFQNLPYKNFTG